MRTRSIVWITPFVAGMLIAHGTSRGSLNAVVPRVTVGCPTAGCGDGDIHDRARGGGAAVCLGGRGREYASQRGDCRDDQARLLHGSDLLRCESRHRPNGGCRRGIRSKQPKRMQGRRLRFRRDRARAQSADTERRRSAEVELPAHDRVAGVGGIAVERLLRDVDENVVAQVDVSGDDEGALPPVELAETHQC